jgi:proteic killer suppression protein
VGRGGVGFRHRGLKRLFEYADRSKLPADRVRRLRLILAALDAADKVEDMDIHTFRPHALKGDLKGYWAVMVRANWRVIFRFAEGERRMSIWWIIIEGREEPCR